MTYGSEPRDCKTVEDGFASRSCVNNNGLRPKPPTRMMNCSVQVSENVLRAMALSTLSTFGLEELLRWISLTWLATSLTT